MGRGSCAALRPAARDLFWPISAAYLPPAQARGAKIYGELVGYAVRFDDKSGPGTRVKFMTDGILMREIQEDLLLRKYSCIVLDEAHERNMNTDVLIGRHALVAGTCCMLFMGTLTQACGQKSWAQRRYALGP